MTEELKNRLEELGFKKIDFKSSDLQYKDVENYAAKIIPSGEWEPETREYVLTISIFKEYYLFSVSDKVGIIKLISLDKSTPVGIIEGYIHRAYKFLSL